jgi:outer membrane protein assembly factor BamB
MLRRYDAFALLAFLSGTLGSLSCHDVAGVGGRSVEPRVLWRVASAPSDNHFPHEPAVNADGSMAYFVTSDYRLKKIRGVDGKVMWDMDVKPIHETFPGWNVVLAGPAVAFAKVDIFAYDSATGRPLWSYVAPNGDETGYSSIVADETTIYAASQGGRAYAINALTGTARWITDLRESRSDVGALTPTLDNGVLYVATHSHAAAPEIATFWALDASTGAIKWTYHFSPEFPQQPTSAYGGAAVWNDLVIEPAADGRVFAFDRATGAVKWIAPRVHSIPPAGTSWGDLRFPAVFGDNLAVTSSTGNVLVGLDPRSGAERWRSADIAGAMYRPAVDEENVYVSYGSIFAAFDVTTGRLRWRDDGPLVEGPRPGTAFHGRPAIANDRLYVGGRDASYSLRK